MESSVSLHFLDLLYSCPFMSLIIELRTPLNMPTAPWYFSVYSSFAHCFSVDQHSAIWTTYVNFWLSVPHTLTFIVRPIMYLYSFFSWLLCTRSPCLLSWGMLSMDPHTFRRYVARLIAQVSLKREGWWWEHTLSRYKGTLTDLLAVFLW